MSDSDHETFGAFVQLHAPAVCRWAIVLTGDQDEADDVTQEVFLRAHRKLGDFRGDGSIEGWLYRITRRVLERRRSKTRRRAQLATLPAAQRTLEVYLTDPGARVDRERTLEFIREIAEILPLRQREVFLLCDLQGHSSLDVATMLGIKDVTVRANLFKARTAIRRQVLQTHPSYQETRS